MAVFGAGAADLAAAVPSIHLPAANAGARPSPGVESRPGRRMGPGEPDADRGPRTASAPPAGRARLAAVEAADRAAGWLPGFASALHRDARSPVNLPPIAGLERHLHRRRQRYLPTGQLGPSIIDATEGSRGCEADVTSQSARRRPPGRAPRPRPGAPSSARDGQWPPAIGLADLGRPGSRRPRSRRRTGRRAGCRASRRPCTGTRGTRPRTRGSCPTIPGDAPPDHDSPLDPAPT